VGNKLLFTDSEFIVMAVGGPNARKDFHHDPGEEIFYQIEGDMRLDTIQDGKRVGIPIRAGELFLLPAHLPHSPQRPAHSVGIVIERRRAPRELDGFSWYCEACDRLLHREDLHVSNIETQLQPLFERFYSRLELRTCKHCGAVMSPPAGSASE
jgi:3-hydroxyanthranilate 3,4-dioxygenase